MKLAKETNKSEDFFRRIHVSLYQTDQDDIITLANPAMAKMFGYDSPENIIGKDLKDFYVEPERRKEFKEILRQQGGSVIGYLARMRMNTGEYFYVSADSKIIKDVKGNEIGVEGVLRRVKKEDIELRRMVDDRDTFMMNISHELRTPMTTILAAAENLQEGRTTDVEKPKALNKIVIELQRLHLMTERLWRAEMIAKGLSVCQPSNVDIWEKLSSSRKMMIPLAERKSIKITINDEIKKWGPIKLDREMFTHAILNLFDNAIKYSYPNTYVKVDGNRHWLDVVLSFQNVGPLISSDEHDKIFERFYRSKKAVAMAPSGSGIGLVLVKDFVEKHEAKIEVKSVPYKEKNHRHLNTFSLIFPK
ncbi:MAG: PAS domain-containing sensor histidine kinase [Thermodesulfobacteriota bacterium]|nr:PAS domain-containing sensor histidine kinase [Thermodesulfobacteriota bacterium]